MRIVRTKKFNIFQDGKNEVLNIMPMSEMCYFELAQCNIFEDTYGKLNVHDIYITVDRESDGFVFSVIFNIDSMRYLQYAFNVHGWKVDDNRCAGLSVQDIIKIENNQW